MKAARIFQDHMVLQRGKEVQVWGTGTEGEQIAVSFFGHSRSAAVEHGGWKVTLPPMEAHRGGVGGAGCIDGCFGRWLDQPAVLWPLGMGRSHPAVAVAVGEQPAHHYGAGDFDPAGAFAGVRPGVRGGDGSGVRMERKQCGRTGGFGGRDASGYGHGQKRTGLEGISARQSGG